jgi:hypothetical protein
MKIKSILLAPFSRLWTYVWTKVDAEFKRMCVMAVLHAKWRLCSEDDLCELDRFNSTFKLCKDTSVLRFPTLFGVHVWNSVPNEANVVTPSDKFFRRIELLTPCWLKYTDPNAYMEELRALYTYCATERSQAS